jgi:hypothetical protein
MSEIEALLKWLEISQKHSHLLDINIEQLKLRIYKSQLLHRMLEGKEVLPVPPPKRNNNPWYSLVETGKDVVYGYDMFEGDGWMMKLYPYPYLMIHQNPWEIIEKISADKYILAYWYVEDNKDVQAIGEWIFEKIIHHVDPGMCVWELKKR